MNLKRNCFGEEMFFYSRTLTKTQLDLFVFYCMNDKSCKFFLFAGWFVLKSLNETEFLALTGKTLTKTFLKSGCGLRRKYCICMCHRLLTSYCFLTYHLCFGHSSFSGTAFLSFTAAFLIFYRFFDFLRLF